MPILFICSMYLMMDYNIDGYIAFLKMIKKLKLHICCCCCCHHMVIEQLDKLNNSDEHVSSDIVVSIKKDKGNSMETTHIFETRNMSMDDQRIATNGRELSIETITNA